MWDRLPAGGAGSVAAAALAVYLVLVVPSSALATRRQWRRRPPAGGAERMTFYRRAISRHWLLAGATIGVAVLARQPASALGLRSPRLIVGGPGAVIAEIALLAIVTAAVLALARSPAAPALDALLPSTGEERKLYAAVAVTAGVVEELLFRGFLMGYAMGALGWSWQQASLASAAAFGIVHLYQGPATAARAALIGFGFAESYTLTGSLLVPVLLHLALDLRPLRWRATDAAQKCSGVSSPSR